MTDYTLKPPTNLEHRFHAPGGWKFYELQRSEYTLRYGFALPQDCKGVVIVLQGLSEFAEKYFEFMREIIAQGYGVFAMDWRGQGLSSRYFEGSDKRHAQKFDTDVEDLLACINACDDIAAFAPFHLFGHSMGGNLALRSLHKKPELFKDAFLCAPMVGLHVFQNVLPSIATFTADSFSKILGNSYAPLGGDWDPTLRDLDSRIFSSDKIRKKIHNDWMREHAELRIGHITNTWLKKAYDSTQFVQKQLPALAPSHKICFTMSEHETLVDNKAIKNLAEQLPNATHNFFKDAGHEVAMERDELRVPFMKLLFHHLG